MRLTKQTVQIALVSTLLSCFNLVSAASSQAADEWVYVMSQSDGLEMYVKKGSIIETGITDQKSFWLRKDATKSSNNDYRFDTQEQKIVVNCGIYSYSVSQSVTRNGGAAMSNSIPGTFKAPDASSALHYVFEVVCAE